MAKAELGDIEGQSDIRAMDGQWVFDDDDWALVAMLADPIYCAELLFEDPKNKEFAGCYHVRDYQYPLFRPSTNYQGYPCARDVGKALANGEPVLTPQGYVAIEDLESGDLAIGSDGLPTVVLGVYPQGVRDLFRVTFKDGTHVDCDGDHLWTVTCDAWGSGRSRTLTLCEMIAHGRARLKVRRGLAGVGPTRFDHIEVEKIKPIGRGLATCIAVSAEDGLFMTRNMVLTHNTESIKARAVSHAFRRMGEDLLITAPELIHLEGVTQQVEARITATRLTREFLRRDSQKTGFTHKPFQCDFADNTRIIGRIPRLKGTGVKGQHVPDLLMDEAQDYPDDGWIEVFPTVQKDHVDATGAYDFTMHFYGVHAGYGGGRFAKLAESAEYKITAITMLQKPGWNKQEKEAAKAMYGGSNSPDYRRNVLGERGARLSQFFVTARLMACMDQDKESEYNTDIFKGQSIEAESLPELIGRDGDVGDLIDLPEGLGQQVFGGMDVGLVSDPTVIQIWAVLPDEKKRPRLTLVRMIHLWRFTEKQIRQVTYRIARQYGLTLRAFGQDITGLGLPLYQAMEADEQCPVHLREVSRGYVFNAKVPVAVDKNYVSEQGNQLVDQYGHIVEVVRDKWTGREDLVARMTMIEASTRYLRGFVDDGYLRLPFHGDLIKDFQGETEQRVRAMAGVKKKPNAFHMLDAARAFAMAYKAGEMEEQVYSRGGQPVLDRAVDLSMPVGAVVQG